EDKKQKTVLNILRPCPQRTKHLGSQLVHHGELHPDIDDGQRPIDIEVLVWSAQPESAIEHDTSENIDPNQGGKDRKTPGPSPPEEHAQQDDVAYQATGPK